MPEPADLPPAVREAARRLADPKPMRRGSLSVRFLKCNKSGCACAEDPDACHGPYTSVVRTVAGKTRSRLVPAAQADVLRLQVEAGQRFRKDVEAYWQACEQWSDAQLEAPEAASDAEAAKKGGSKKPSRPRSRPRMYLGMDGTAVPMRKSELVGREGKQPDGSSKTREVKLVTVWSAEDRDDEGTPVRDAGSVTYSAAIESAATRDTDETPSEFAQRVEREAHRRGFDQAQCRVVLGDGAPWIWNLADEHFPGAIQIVDLYHAKGHLWDVAKAIYGAGSDLGEMWAKQRRDELDEGKLDAVLTALHVHAEANDEARKCLDYVTRNRHRMRYPKFRAQGLCTSTGVVEAGCKTAIGTRCKRAGMHWTVAGADAIIALRCCKLSGRFEDFWEHRSAAATGTAA